MCAYYNENDPKAAAWLRELIKAGLLRQGEVDERSIVDVRGSDFRGYSQCHFFAGIGGWAYALRLAEWPDDREVWTGSCPCQPFSQAGQGKGEQDKRHLWPDFRRLIEECSPAAVFGEQVASKAGRRWLNGVRVDLEAMEYEVGAADLCSAGVGAPHIRQRLYWVADSGCKRNERRGVTGFLAGAREQFEGQGLDEAGWDNSLRERERCRDAVINCGTTSRMGDTNDTGPQGRREHAGEYTDQRATGEAGSACGMGEPNSAGRFSRRQASETSGYWDSAQPAGYWSGFDVVHCTDDKARRIEPGTFPLAHGVPARMGRLRGYGNAITPQIAAEFIKAYMEER